MSTEAQKRKQTMSVLDQLRKQGTPRSAKFRDEFTEEELPAEEEMTQEEFERQKAARTEQGLLNKADMSEPLATAYGAVSGGMRPGPTGMDEEGMTPLSPEEFERRSRFSRIRKPEPKKKPDAVAEKKRTKKKEDDSEGSDEPVWVNAEY